MACSSIAQSSTVQAIGPVWSSVYDSGSDARRLTQPIGRLDAGDAAQRRRAADRTAGVGPGAAQDQPGGNGGAGAGGEPAVK